MGDLLTSLQQQGRLRGDTLSPLLRASPDEVEAVLGSRLTAAAANCPALREVAAARLRAEPKSDVQRLPDGTRRRVAVDRSGPSDQQWVGLSAR